MKAKQIFIRDKRSPKPKSRQSSILMSAIRGKNTTPEVLLRKAFQAGGLRGYRLHWSAAPGRPDISWPGKQVAVFVHGCYWHRCPYCKPTLPNFNKEFWQNKFKKNKERDKRKSNQLKKQGWRVYIFWECQIKKGLLKRLPEIKRRLNSL